MNTANTFKKCGFCGKEVALEHFHLNRKSKDGFQSNCKTCQNKIMKSEMKKRRIEEKLLKTTQSLERMNKQYMELVQKVIQSKTQITIQKLPDYVSFEYMPKIFVREDGYCFEWCPNRKMYFMAHILAVLNQKKLNKLPYGFCVHHKDRNRQNNNIENLIMLQEEDHKRLHAYLNSHPEAKLLSFEQQREIVDI